MMKRSFLSGILPIFLALGSLSSMAVHAVEEKASGFYCITAHQGRACVSDFKVGTPADNKFWCDDEALSYRWIDWSDCKDSGGVSGSKIDGGSWGGNPFKG